MLIVTFIDEFRQHKQAAIIDMQKEYSYGWLIDQIETYLLWLEKTGIQAGTVVQLNADFSAQAIAMLFALAKQGCIIMPLTNLVIEKQQEYQAIVQVEYVINFEADQVIYRKLSFIPNHELILFLRAQQHPGLVIMSSGSTGKSKAIVHDLRLLLEKFTVRKTAFKTLSCLLFDHIGGLNTLFSNFYQGGTLVIPTKREPLVICQSIAVHQVDVLITSPSFLNLMLLSGTYQQHNLSSLKIVNYGSEVMPISLLARLNNIFPHIKFSQAYGLSEIGVLNVKSKSSDSLLVKISDNHAKVRISDGMLEIKSPQSMLGYLNAMSPYTEDGWFKTGDMVIQEGEFIQILGRVTDIINVGGEKVYPAEIESVLLMMPEIEDVIVMGEANAILGNLVKTKVKLKNNVNKLGFKNQIKIFCKDKLPAFKIPQKIEFIEEYFHGERFKKMRNSKTNYS